MAARKWRVAIIGTGRMGGLIEDELPARGFGMPYGHLSAYRAIPECEVVAVANRGEERLKRFVDRFGIANAYLDYREMIDRERPDIVSITTPSFARAEPIIHCATHGVPAIYAEKGLCGSLAEADAIAVAVRANHVAFNWGTLRRHHDGYRQLRETIARGDIGEPRHATMWFFTDLIKHHPHTIDIVAMLLGDPAPVWVQGSLVNRDDPRVASRTRPEPIYDPRRTASSHRKGTKSRILMLIRFGLAMRRVPKQPFFRLASSKLISSGPKVGPWRGRTAGTLRFVGSIPSVEPSRKLRSHHRARARQSARFAT